MIQAPALADVLEDFGYRRPVAPEILPFAFTNAPGGPDIASDQAAAGPDLDELIRTEVDKAERELAERLTAEHGAALAEERERHAAELEALNRQLGETIGTAVVSEMAAMQEAVTALVTSVTARILGPVLTADVHARSVAALAAMVREAMEDAESMRVKITGSPALYEALCGVVGDKVAYFDFTESPAMDLTVRIDDRLFETRLSEWSAAMEETLS